jgi:hypothetical protein
MPFHLPFPHLLAHIYPLGFSGYAILVSIHPKLSVKGFFI